MDNIFRQKTKDNYLIYIFPKSNGKFRKIDYKYHLPFTTVKIPITKKDDAHAIGDEIYIAYKELSLKGIEPFHCVVIAEDQFNQSPA